MVLSTTGRHILGCLKMTGARLGTNNFVMCKVIPLKVLSRFDKSVAVGMFAVQADEHGSAGSIDIPETSNFLQIFAVFGNH